MIHGFVRNEEDVGKAIKESGIPRDKLFVTTKVAIEIVCTVQGYCLYCVSTDLEL